jgi:hypothetical protein
MKSSTPCLPLFVLALSLSARSTAATNLENAPDTAASLGSLTTGSLDERIAAANDVWDLVQRLHADPSGVSFDELVEQLIDAMQQEPDDWVTRTVLAQIVDHADGFLAPLFQEGLQSSSPNVRAVAVRWYMDNQHPEALDTLESLWDKGVPSWSRSDLMDALVEQGSSRFTREFIRLARDTDRAVRLRALKALGRLALLGRLADDDALPVLLEGSRDSDPRVAATALKGLSMQTDSESALDAVLAAARSGAPAQKAALEALGSFVEERSGQRLIEVLDDPHSDPLYEVAAESLRDSHHPHATEALVHRLALAFSSGGPSLASTIVGVLWDRDDREAGPALLDIAASLQAAGDDAWPNQYLLRLIAFLDRDREGNEPIQGRGSQVTLGCFLPRLDTDDPGIRRIVPPPDRQTVRCWERPAHAASPSVARRIPAGTLFVPSDYFDWNGETWLLLRSQFGPNCWVPEHLSARGAAGTLPPSHVPLEFDFQAVALETPTATRLVASGAIATFEAEEDVVGVRFLLDVDDPRLRQWFEEMEQLGLRFADGLGSRGGAVSLEDPASQEDPYEPEDDTPMGETAEADSA